MGRPKLMKNLFEPDRVRKRVTPQGSAGYDNSRENIDPRIVSKTILLQQGRVAGVPIVATDIVNKAYADVISAALATHIAAAQAHSDYALNSGDALSGAYTWNGGWWWINGNGNPATWQNCLTFGASGNSLICYNGSNLIIDPDYVGAGIVMVGQTGDDKLQAHSMGIHGAPGAQGLNCDAQAVFNESGADYDFRVEGVGAANALFVQGSDGKVGIGTATPGEKLDIDGGNVRIQDTNAYLKYLSDTNVRAWLGFVSDTVFRIWTREPSSIDFLTNNLVAMTVDGSQRVGIGTATPAKLLHLQSASSPTLRIDDTTNSVLLEAQSLDTTAWVGTSSNHDFRIRTNGAERITVQGSDGFVGIGTTTPSEALDVNGRIKDKTGYVCPCGMITMYGAAAAPSGWVLCDGASLLRAGTYADLFAVIGITFGSEDGTHFNAPDMRGIFPRGKGTTDRALGVDANDAAYTATLGAYSQDQFQGHFHSVTHNVHTGSRDRADGGGAVSRDYNGTVTVGNPTTDGVSGTPRTGVETNPANLGLAFIIKY